MNKTCNRCGHSFTSDRYKYCDACREYGRMRYHDADRPAHKRRISASILPAPARSPAELCPDCFKPLTLYRGWDEATGNDQWYCHRCQSAKQPGAVVVRTRKKSVVQAFNAAIQQAIREGGRTPIERRCRRIRR